MNGYRIMWPGFIPKINALRVSSQGKRGKRDPVVPIHFLLGLWEDTAYSWRPCGVPGWRGQGCVSRLVCPWKPLGCQLLCLSCSLSTWDFTTGLGLLPSPGSFGIPISSVEEVSAHTWAAELLSSFPPEAGWAWSQSSQLFECRGKLHHLPQPERGGLKGGMASPWGDIFPVRDSPGFFERRLQKSLWFIGTCCSSLKENNYFFPPPQANLKSSPMRTLSKEVVSLLH